MTERMFSVNRTGAMERWGPPGGPASGSAECRAVRAATIATWRAALRHHRAVLRSAMVSFDARLAAWVEAGLITAEQAGRIEAFEHRARDATPRIPASQSRPTFLYAIGGLGGLAIAVGLVSIVAANWDAITPATKIGLDLGLVAALGLAVWHWDRRGHELAREIGIVVLYGLVLASIALIGQVYQLGGEAHEALLTWSVLTAVIMTRSRSGFAASIWLFGLQATWLAWAVWLADTHHAEMLALGTIYWAPLLCVGVGRLPAVRRARPGLAAALASIGWFELLLCATLGTFAFYADTAREPWLDAWPAVAISVVLTVAVATGLLESLPQRVLLVSCGVLAHVPLFISPGDLELVAAGSFIGLWLLVAWTAHVARDHGQLSLATAMIGLRIIAIYFEVFGSLLDTGLGLVVGGLLTLGIVWVWARKRRQFEQEFAGTGVGVPGPRGVA